MGKIYFAIAVIHRRFLRLLSGHLQNVEHVIVVKGIVIVLVVKSIVFAIVLKSIQIEPLQLHVEWMTG